MKTILLGCSIFAGSCMTASAQTTSDKVNATTVANVPMLTLNNGVEMPQFGLGTFCLPEGSVTKNAVLTALKRGYRHFDTAHAYRNERSVGAAVRESGIPREEIWITSKLWPNEYGEGKTLPAVDKMLNRLGLEYIDLIYLHQPVGDYVGAWRELEKAVAQGKVRAIGISNFDFSDALFDSLMDSAQIKPAAMQIECHPYAQRRHWQKRLQETGTVLESWFPLGGRESKGELLRDPVINRIAAAHEKTAAQIIIRWHIQEGFSVIPGTDNPEYIAENISIFDFELSKEDMEDLRALDSEKRYFTMTYEGISDRFGKYEIDD
ncbi:aldo/keto reductase [Bacteroides uniformis]|nr:aldo/keto reductase [Bacteroides uniformis]